MRVGIYARVSRESSDNTNQLLLLRDYCSKMNYKIHDEYIDVVSGGAPFRPEFNRMMKDASQKKFGMLLFFSLDRLSREGTRKTIQYLQMLDDYNVIYKSYTEQYIDSSGIFKDVIISLLASLALQERIRCGERVRAGLAKARMHNRIGGRPRLNDIKIEKIKNMRLNGMNVSVIAKELKISRGSVYQYIKSCE